MYKTLAIPKKPFINSLCYAAILGSVGCNHINKRMGMMQEEVSEENALTSASRDFDKFLETKRELEKKSKAIDIKEFLDSLETTLKPFFGDEVAKSKFKSENLALETFRKKGEAVMALLPKVPTSQSEIEEWSALPNLDMPELYYLSLSMSKSMANSMIEKEVSCRKTVNSKFENGEDLKVFMQTSKDTVSELVKSLKEYAQAYPSLKAWWVTLMPLATALGSVVEEIMEILNHKGAYTVPLALAPLPKEVEALLEKIEEWDISSKVKAVLRAEAILKQLMQTAAIIKCSKLFLMYAQELGVRFITIMERVQSEIIFGLFASVKEIILSAEKIWPKLVVILREKKAVLASIIQNQQAELLEKCFQKDRDAILQAIKERETWLVKLEQALQSKEKELSSCR